MPFRLPTFNLSAKVWTGVVGVLPPAGLPRVTLSANLRLYKTALVLGGTGLGGTLMALLVPRGSDIRPGLGFWGTPDTVECPAGSGRYYDVLCVDDVARGFANEYRLASLKQRPLVGAPPIP